jgi:hypothetical protein
MCHRISRNSPIIEAQCQSNKILYFTSTDTEILFELNKKTQGEEWIYHNKKIEYKYNSWGYRTKEFTELSDDYILTFGCSFTEGIGLHYDDMWSTKLGKKLNLDVFNLGMGASGVDYQFYNTILFQNFILEKKKLPKLVVYQWPMSFRTSAFFKLKEDNKTDLIMEFFSPHFIEETGKKKVLNSFYDWFKDGFVNDGGDSVKQNYLYTMLCNNIWKSLNIPVINWTYDEDFENLNDEIFNLNFQIHRIYDDTMIRGRDLMHNGHLAQDLVVNKIIENLNGHGFSK